MLKRTLWLAGALVALPAAGTAGGTGSGAPALLIALASGGAVGGAGLLAAGARLARRRARR